MFTRALPRSIARRSTRTLSWTLAGCALALSIVGVDAASAATKVRSITCRGGGDSCAAVIGLAGGASNVKLRITLSDTDLKLVSRVVKPSSVRGAYSLSKGSYSLGGSLYTVTLNAVQSIPKGSTLTLRFAAPTESIGK
ncbi:MAG TPA: hypothetical protein VK761_04955 [Solirubrobacteraceae bacterium]|jgi:hypothetical protein|nr:hypothetical protein [Solirubrobacteraceae bacterium]